MHRSGTSCLMGTLEQHGLHAGNNNKNSKYNTRGNREMPSIRKFHDDVWADLKTDWMHPAFVPHFNEDQQQQLKHILSKEYTDHAVIGIKDPRLLFFIDAWTEITSLLDIVIFASFRHPYSVARSLFTRNNIHIDEGIRIWTTYNLQLLNILEKYHVHFVNFDEKVGNYHSHIQDLYSQHIGHAQDITNELFYDKKLKNHTFQEYPLDQKTLDVYNKLLTLYDSSQARK